MRFTLCLVVLAGCSAEAIPVESSDPMAIVWEQTYGMDRATRPIVQWHNDCRSDDDGAGRERVVTVGGGCVQAIVYATGAIELQTASQISESLFALALEQWRQWLMASAFAPIDGCAIATANNALAANGL